MNKVRNGKYTIRGLAYNGGGGRIERVELSVDGGKSIRHSRPKNLFRQGGIGITPIWQLIRAISVDHFNIASTQSNQFQHIWGRHPAVYRIGKGQGRQTEDLQRALRPFQRTTSDIGPKGLQCTFTCRIGIIDRS
ncbi:hypothetical protein BD311DRAFT_122776 [Dichomitus squalens]|uniref:Moybdenum cofactor oxidoreductase dimerisation domain-containing protein n=1 Tax=Dichomitus squalens TaxID=114155 RepID=A0A4Q9MW47_9APHY|nr:hypothetical protein BD311DRAFT_122776 [Dichomitus squalens]